MEFLSRYIDSKAGGGGGREGRGKQCSTPMETCAFWMLFAGSSLSPMPENISHGEKAWDSPKVFHQKCAQKLEGGRKKV